MHKPLSEVHVMQEIEENYDDKEGHNVLTQNMKRQYMRGISATPSQGGVYYEALKGSSNSLAKGWVLQIYE